MLGQHDDDVDVWAVVGDGALRGVDVGVAGDARDEHGDATLLDDERASAFGAVHAVMAQQRIAGVAPAHVVEGAARRGDEPRLLVAVDQQGRARLVLAGVDGGRVGELLVEEIAAVDEHDALAVRLSRLLQQAREARDAAQRIAGAAARLDVALHAGGGDDQHAIVFDGRKRRRRLLGRRPLLVEWPDDGRVDAGLLCGALGRCARDEHRHSQ